MRTSTIHRFAVLGPCFAASGLLFADTTPDLSNYAGVDTAIAAKVVASGGSGQTGYLGASVERNAQGQLVIEQVQPNSPAGRAGLRKGDIVTRVGEHAVRTPDAFREWLQARGPNETVKLGYVRAGTPLESAVTLIATSRPMKIGGARVFFGAELGAAKEEEGVVVDRVAPDSPAATAGLKRGDFITKAENADLSRGGRLADVLAEKRPGDLLNFSVRREGKEVALKATLVADRGEGGRGGPRGNFQGGRGPGGPGDGPPGGIWKKPVIRIGVVGVEFPDVKHNSKVAMKDWQEAFFSNGVYANKDDATGQKVHGSLNDYFAEQSSGALKIEGKAFEWVEVGKKRGDYVQGSGTSNKTAVLSEALDKIAARDGKEAVKDYDALLFIYAGERYNTNRGAVYYPHSGTVTVQGRRMPYLLGVEGGGKMTPVGGFVKELGRVLGLPDLAARPENQGSEGLGPWCAMSNPLTTSRPQHLSPWCKEKMGWLKPTVIDPTVKQKLVLSPIETSPKECFKVLVRPDGSEYLLLENRGKRGFDADLQGEGMLIWRVVRDRPILEEAHGVEGPAGPTVHLNAVPFPTAASRAFTPDTTPSSVSPLGGGLPVHITQIRRLPEGKIGFQIGYEFY